MDQLVIALTGATMLAACCSAAEPWRTWPPRDYLVRSLVAGTEKILASYHPQTGRFGTEPWICSDQNVLLPLAVAWELDDPNNPYFHDQNLLEVIARGGEVLVDEQDEQGQWTFRKKDNSTWGQILMPWTYSRWIRAYQIVGQALPAASRSKWEQGLRLGFRVLAGRGFPHVHNIPTHHAMALYIAGQCFDQEQWCQAAREFMPRVVAAQDPAGFWSEHFGPVVSYNFTYVEALGVYYHYTRDPAVLEALRRAAVFHAGILWPDGSSVACIDERVIYLPGVATGNVGFSWTPEGRGFLLRQIWQYSAGGERLIDADWAATMLRYGGTGEGIAPPATADESTAVVGDLAQPERGAAVIRRSRPWQWALSGYACPPLNSRWIQDRHNLLDVYHDTLGLVIGGGNTKLQPYWSTFTVGDPSLLRHTPGDENPNFVPDIDLLWTPQSARITTSGEALLSLQYGDVSASVTVSHRPDDSLALCYRAPAGRRAEAHVPLRYRGARLVGANGRIWRLTDEELDLSADELGGGLVYRELSVSVPDGCRVLWPARQHDPYTKDGRSSLSNAKLVLVLPFEDTDERTVIVAHAPTPAFAGIVLDARELPVEISEGSYTKVLDDLGSRFLGNNRPGSFIRFTLPPIAPGRYEVLGDFVLAYVYGIVRVLFDGRQIGEPFDAWCPGVDADGWPVSFGEVDITGAGHSLTVEVIGRNDRASNNMISIKRWLLRPVPNP